MAIQDPDGAPEAATVLDHVGPELRLWKLRVKAFHLSDT